MRPTPVRSPRASPVPLLTFLFGLTLSLAPASSGATSPAQDARYDIPPQVVQVTTQASQPLGPDIPAPPKVLRTTLPPHQRRAVPVGTGGNPMPNSLPTQVADVTTSPTDFKVFYSTQCAPAGWVPNFPMEPNVVQSGDTALYTFNADAAVSIDQGASWSRLSPYLLFPASDGGFCCDQRLVQVPSHDLTVWLLQYWYSASTQAGRHRVAVATSRDDLKAGAFHFFDLTPQTFNQPNGWYMDFPDLTWSDDHLYGSANFYRGSDNANMGSVLWRATLDDVRQGGNFGLQFYLSSTLGSELYRLAQRCTDRLWACASWNTTTIRLYFWPSAGNISFENKTIAPITTATSSAVAPDGRDWAGFCDHRPLGAYFTGAEVGFLFSSGPNGAGRPRGYVRSVRINPTTRAITREEDIWAATNTVLYPAVAVNARGHVGVTMTIGGGGLYPGTYAALVDDVEPNFGGRTYLEITTGDAGPAQNRWGDYFSVAQHPVMTNTFIATGAAQSGGPFPSQVHNRFVWFGRERDEPGWVDANVTATDQTTGTVPLVASVAIAQTDRFRNRNGTTPLARSYAPRQAWNLTAPLYATGPGGATFYFDSWIYQGNTQPSGQRTLDVSDLGTGPRTVAADARYLPVFRLTVDSVPVTGVAIAVSRTDVNGLGNGTTPFTRNHLPNRLTVTAPAQAGNNLFRWWVLNGVPQTPGLLSILFDISTATTAIADYGAVAGGTDWKDITALSPVQPSPRSSHAIVYDSARDRMVLFGGTGAGSAETWELDGVTWAQAAPATSPSGRSGHAMAYDPVSGLTLLFGGGNLADTWSYDGIDWTQQAPATSPLRRNNAAMAFDRTAGRYLLFGGSFLGVANNETWEFDGTDWTQLSPATVPPPLSSPSMTYDTRRNRIVMVGAVIQATAQFQTWEWDGVDWIRMAPANEPPGRYLHPLVFDSLRGRSVLFSAGFQSPLQDTWEWDGVDWRQRYTATLPPARWGHAMAYDPVRHRCVMFGGYVGANTLNDTWEYSFDYEIIGEGHPGGGLPLTCVSRPQIGQNFCVEFPSSQTIGFLLIGLGPPVDPPLPVAPPEFCNAGSLHAFPDLLLDAPGNPATLCIPIPNDVSLVGALVTVQGMALEAAFCLQLTDGVAVILQQ